MSVPDPATTYWVPMASPSGGADLTYEGDFVAATEYQDGDIVVKDGIAYLCVGGPTTTPPDIAPWGAAGALQPIIARKALAADTFLAVGPTRTPLISITLGLPSACCVLMHANVLIAGIVANTFSAIYGHLDGAGMAGEIDAQLIDAAQLSFAHTFMAASVSAGTHTFDIGGSCWTGGASAAKALATGTILIVQAFPGVTGLTP